MVKGGGKFKDFGWKMIDEIGGCKESFILIFQGRTSMSKER
jgi:hypothetical protein